MKIKIYLLVGFFLLSFNYCSVHRQLDNSNNGDKIAERMSYLKEISVSLQQKWPNNRTINIVCHGHSVPAGYFETPSVNTFEAYPHLLHQILKTHFPFAVINVFVTAIGGETSESGARRFDRDVLSIKPDVITIDYALNDRGIGLARAKKAWTTMIAAAKKRGSKVILMTPTADKRADFENPNDPLNLHAEQIRQLAKKYQVGLVDSYACFGNYVKNGGHLDDLMSQVNHPNRRGHELIAQELWLWFK